LSVAIHHWDDKNWAVVIGKRYHGETCGVHALVVGCDFANLLAMEYEQHYIQKYLDTSQKEIPSSIQSCTEEIKLHFSQIPLQKWGI
jgi:hypothetical protein